MLKASRLIRSDIAPASGQIALHDQCVQFGAARVTIILFASTDGGEAGTLVETDRRRVVLLDFKEHSANAASGKMAEVMGDKLARVAAPAVRLGDGD